MEYKISLFAANTETGGTEWVAIASYPNGSTMGMPAVGETPAAVLGVLAINMEKVIFSPK